MGGSSGYGSRLMYIFSHRIVVKIPYLKRSKMHDKDVEMALLKLSFIEGGP